MEKQYLQLLKDIKQNGTYKSAAREGMPGTYSLFGYQMRHNLQEGFPLLTTKKLSFKNIVTELLWFLKGDTNIKYLVDNGCNIWNEDAYNYYLKLCNKQHVKPWVYETWLEFLKEGNNNHAVRSYKIGDCGKQYGWLWRNWEDSQWKVKNGETYNIKILEPIIIDQIKELIDGLKNNPMSRRHIITAWNPATLDDMALNACHCFVQFNCRPVKYLSGRDTPKYYLDCQMYQRSADSFLG